MAGWIRFVTPQHKPVIKSASAIDIHTHNDADGCTYIVVSGWYVGRSSYGADEKAELDRLTAWLAEGGEGVYVVGEGAVKTADEMKADSHYEGCVEGLRMARDAVDAEYRKQRKMGEGAVTWAIRGVLTSVDSIFDRILEADGVTK